MKAAEAAVVAAYMECALWSSNDESDEYGGEPMDKNYCIGDIAEETQAEMEKDCLDFIEEVGVLYEEYVVKSRYGYEGFGHDFWLTRNGHGAGFWDRGLGELGDMLSDAAKVYGSYDLYVGDDGKIYGQ